MKKIVAVVGYDEMASRFYAGQVRELFGDLVSVHSYSVNEGTVSNLQRSDLYAVSTDAFESTADLREFIPIDGETVEMGVTFSKEVLPPLMEIPRGAKTLFVNLSEKMVREAITRLDQLGVNHIEFTPFYPGAAPVSGFDYAVTPGERRYVPESVEHVIDIGQRMLDYNTIVEIALKLKLDFVLEEKNCKDYFQLIVDNSYSFDEIFTRSTRLESRFEILTELLDEGIIGINEESRVFACNTKAAEITGVNQRLVLNRDAAEAFPYIPFEECRKDLRRIENRLISRKGVALNVTVTPVLRLQEYVGAFATVQRFSEEESKQHNLRIQLLNKGHHAKYTFGDIIGGSTALRKAVDIAAKMAKNNSSVLITGESGTGKELFAHSIHNASSRRDYPFIAINCAAIPDNLLESELFGYEEGAFTGGKKGGKLGLFEFAHRGSIFLDEVEGMSPALQIKLLRVIQEREVMRVGGNKIISIDVRIIAATNENLEQLVAGESFRRDLYYRLNTLPIHLPALRERDEDIMMLFNHFKGNLGGQFELDNDAEAALRSHHWEGNIRELRNYVEYLTYMEKPVITCEDLPPGFHSAAREAPAPGNRDADLDYEAFRRMACRRMEEYLFVLEVLNQGRLDKTPVGRDTLLVQAEARGLPLSQREVRDILANLEAMNFVKITKGRGGSKITARGVDLLRYGN